MQQSTRLFADVSAEDIRIMFRAMADRGLGEVDGMSDHLGWKWSS
ncbi:MAG: hypothetical protein ACYTXC_17360 [Nostoc sp.]